MLLAFLIFLAGCKTEHELVAPKSDVPPPKAPVAIVRGVAFDAIRDGRPGPAMVLRMEASLPNPPHALGVTLRCKVGPRVFVDEGQIVLSRPAPPTLSYAVYGGLPFPSLPEVCAVSVQSLPAPGSGAKARGVGAFCVRPGRVAASCDVPARGSPVGAKRVVDDVAWMGDDLVFTTNHWEATSVTLRTKTSTRVVSALGTSRRGTLPGPGPLVLEGQVIPLPPR